MKKKGFNLKLKIFNLTKDNLCEQQNYFIDVMQNVTIKKMLSISAKILSM